MSDAEAYRRTMDRLIEDVWNDHNLDVLPEVFTEDATMHHGGSGDRGGNDMAGMPAFREGYIRPTQAAFPDIRHEVKDLLFDGDKVVMRFDGDKVVMRFDGDKVVMRFHGEGTHEGAFSGVQPTGKVIRYEGIAIFRMEGARIAEIWVLSNFAKNLAALQD